MSKIPTYVFIVTCMHPKKDRELSEILTEYLEILPHIVYADPTLYDSDIYYIVPYNNTLRAILGNITAYIDLFNTFGFATYGLQTSSSAPTFTKNIVREFYNFRYFPLNITINPKYLEKLKSISDD